MNDPETRKTRQDGHAIENEADSTDIPSELLNAPTKDDGTPDQLPQLKLELKRLGNDKGTSRFNKDQLIGEALETLGGGVSLTKGTLTDLVEFAVTHSAAQRSTDKKKSGTSDEEEGSERSLGPSSQGQQG